MKMIASKMKSLWKDESAQGSTEYILLLAVVAILGMVFKNKIVKLVEDKMGNVSDGVNKLDATSGG
jgi:Flp pilus assembly pilin Flp